MHARQFQKALYVSRANGWAEFVSMQNYVNLIYREEEREMLPICREEGVGVIPWSPLARGKLTRPVGEETLRSETDPVNKALYVRMADNDAQVIGVVERIAAQRGVPMAQVAIAWVLAQEGITAPIIGVSKLAQLDDAIAALDVKLTVEEIAALEAPYEPHPVMGFQ
jgi:1-deoxyxylulose-5-phosphate synthase